MTYYYLRLLILLTITNTILLTCAGSVLKFCGGGWGVTDVFTETGDPVRGDIWLRPFCDELRSIILGSLALESANDVNFIFIHRP